jgi:hypothetical protein
MVHEGEKYMKVHTFLKVTAIISTIFNPSEVQRDTIINNESKLNV